jgi:ABC-type sugar transport system substrate-binding protein
VKKRSARVRCVALAVGVAAGLAACSSGGASSGNSAVAVAKSGGNKIAYLEPLGSDPSVQSVAAGMECEAKEDGDSLLLFDAGFDQSTQISQFDTAMIEGAKGIVAHDVNEEAMYPSYAQATDKHIPVIDFTGLNDNPPDATHVSENETVVAKTTVNALLKEIPKGGKAIMIGGPPDVAGVAPREDGFRAAAAKAGIQILGEEDSLTLAASDVQDKASSLLLKYPQANIIWGVTAATAAVAGQVAKAQGKVIGKNMFVVGAGADAAVANDVRQGVLTDMVDVEDFAQGEALVTLLNEAIAGKKISNPTFAAEDYTKASINSWVAPNQECGH